MDRAPRYQMQFAEIRHDLARLRVALEEERKAVQEANRILDALKENA